MLNINIKPDKATYNIKCPRNPLLPFPTPPRVVNFKAIVDTCTMFIHILCVCVSVCVLLQLVTDGSPSKHFRKMRSNGKKRTECKRTPWKIMRQQLLVQNFCAESCCPNGTTVLDFILHYKKAVEVHKRLTPYKLPNSGDHLAHKCTMFIRILCMRPCSWWLMAAQTKT